MPALGDEGVADNRRAESTSMSLPAFAPRLSFVDVETTGTSPERARVTEVGIVAVDFDGEDTRVTEWSTLVNPGVPIPAEIQWLTGITNEMVRAAPPFAELAQDIYDRLDGAVFIAHNARFDYGFLRAEFARVDLAFNVRTLCTVRLSRFLYPDRAPHSLDAIIERFGLPAEDRHRALGDARVLWRFLQKLADRHPPAELELALATLLKRPSLPAHLAPDALDALPNAPGVYLFYGLNEHPIYVGKSVDLRARVAGHFNADHRAARELRLSQEVHRLEWEETAGELGALLRESELIKTRLPAHNLALRRKLNQVMMHLDETRRPRFIRCADFSPEAPGQYYGPFGSRTATRHFLVELAAGHGLCLRTMGLERRAKSENDGPCFSFQLHRCKGACVGQESIEQHRARLTELLAPFALPPWPYAGAIALVERNADRYQEQFHVFDRWCWLGTARSLGAAQEMAGLSARSFEPDAARLAVQALGAEPRWALEVVTLEETGAVRSNAPIVTGATDRLESSDMGASG